MLSFIEQYTDTHPERVARYIETASVDVAVMLLKELQGKESAIFQNFSPYYLTKLLRSSHQDYCIGLLRNLNMNLLATVINPLDRDTRNSIIETLEEPDRLTLEELLRYNVDQVGHYLEHCKNIISENSTVSYALDIVEYADLAEPIFIVSTTGQYQGTLDLALLIKARHKIKEPIHGLVKKTGLQLKATTPIRNIIRHREWLSNAAIPVIGKTNCLLGVISRKKIKNRFQKGFDFQSKEISSDKVFYAYESVWLSLQKFWGALK